MAAIAVRDPVRARPRPAPRSRRRGPCARARSTRSSRPTSGRRLRRAQPVEGGPVLARRSRAGPRSPRSRPAPFARRAPRGARSCRRSSRGRSAARSAGPRARRLEHGARSPRTTPAASSPGVVGAFAVNSSAPSNATASVKVPPTSTPSSTPHRLWHAAPGRQRARLSRRALALALSHAAPSRGRVPRN